MKAEEVTTEAKPRMVLEAFIKSEYVGVDGKTRRHPNGFWVKERNEDGNEVERFKSGSQIFSTGAGGGPGVELLINQWCPLPEGPGGAHIARYLRTDPEERLRVKLRARPHMSTVDNILDDPEIPHLTAEQYMESLREEKKPRNKGGRPRKDSR